MDKISAVLNRFPRHAYDSENKSSKLYKLIESIVSEFNITMENINRIDKMTSIDTALPDDLYDRFGTLLNIRRNKDEADEQYRNRLKTSVTALSGGTADAIKYAVACGLGINNDPVAMENIHIYDAWKYDGDAEVIKDYGYVVCDIDLKRGDYSASIDKIVKESADSVKSAGVIIQFIYHNFRILYYAELDNITYASLGTLVYNGVGE